MLTNVSIWNSLRAEFPSFASHTSKGTNDMFTEAGFQALKQTDPQALNDFFGLSLRVSLMAVKASHAKDTLEDKGFGEYFSQPFGAIIQKIAVNSIKPVTPKFRNLENGDSVDPFVVRKPTSSERFFKQNFDYQSFITIPDDFQQKMIFISEFGMSEYMAAIMEGLQNGYIIQKYENKLEVLNNIINSAEYPLKDTQKMSVTLSETPTPDEVVDLILAILNVVDAMNLAPQTDAFNAYGFSSTQNVEDLCVLIRPGYMNRIMMALPQIFHYKESPLEKVKFIEVPNFGGLKYYSDKAHNTEIFPAYNDLGEQIGWSKSKEGEVDTSIKNVYTVDPNEKVLGMIADKHCVFEAQQNSYTVEPIRNPRGLYTNYWASSVGNTIAYDPIYNVVAINF